MIKTKSAVAVKAVIFDLDGTIVDSMGTILRTFQRVFKEEGMAVPEPEKIAAVFGRGGRGIVLELLGPERSRDAVLVERLTVRQREISNETLNEIGVMEGAEETLRALKERGIKVAVATNRGPSTEKLLDMLGLSEYFDVVVTARHVRNIKPHPEPLLTALDLLGVKPEEALFVGDSDIDLQTGKAAGIKTMLLTKDNVREQHIGSLLELKALLERGW